MDYTLEARGVSLRFGGVKALTDVSFGVREGELFSIIGPNGAGKSTFFNILSGTLSPSTGTLRFKGQALNGLPQHRFVHRGISRSYQITNIFPDLSVHENVRVAAQAMSVSYDIWRRRADLVELSERADAALTAVGLIGKRGEQAKFLAHGQQRALEIAIALVSSRSCCCWMSRPPAWGPRKPRTWSRCSSGWPSGAPCCWSSTR